EKPWKETLAAAIPAAPPSPVALGIGLDFRLVGAAGGEQKSDFDNLCEPVLSVLIGQYLTVARAPTRYRGSLRFGTSAGNIGDLATGPVTATLDCLYPVLGGVAGAPEDWRIVGLYVEKDVAAVPDGSVAISVSRGIERRWELRRGGTLLGHLHEYETDWPW